MTEFDPLTMTLMAGLVVTLCGVIFILNTVLRRNDAVGRLWSVAFTAGILQTLAYAVWGLRDDAWWALAVGNLSFVVALGMMWSGCRRANERRAYSWVPLVAGLLAALAVLVHGPDGGEWAGAFEMFLAAVVFTALAASETLRGRLRHNLNARTLTVLFSAICLFYMARAVTLPVLGPADEFFVRYFGSIPATIVNVCIVLIGTVTLSTIQAERFRQTSVDGRQGAADTASDVREVNGVLGPRAFRDVAESWLLRSVRERSTLALILVDVANLEEINIAFGRAAGDSAIRLVGRVAMTESPAAALVGHLSGQRFAILTPAPALDDLVSRAQRIRESVLNRPLEATDRFRAATHHGFATTGSAGSRYRDLLEAARLSLEADAAAAEERSAEPLGVGPRGRS